MNYVFRIIHFINIFMNIMCIVVHLHMMAILILMLHKKNRIFSEQYFKYGYIYIANQVFHLFYKEKLMIVMNIVQQQLL